MADIRETANSLPPGFLHSKSGKDEWKETARRGKEPERNGTADSSITSSQQGSSTFIHQPLYPTREPESEGQDYTRGLQEMDVLRADKEQRDRGSNGEVTKGIVKQDGTFFQGLHIPKRCPHPNSDMAYPRQIPASGNSSQPRMRRNLDEVEQN